MRPEFITFTGVDDATSIDGMRELADQYPIEWGVLFSRKWQGGGGRYPSLDRIGELMVASSEIGLSLSAHLCGEHARDVIMGGKHELDDAFAACFKRVQLNSQLDYGTATTDHVAAWANRLGVMAVMQSRAGEFPADDNVQWLFDRSGGRGVWPSFWPRTEERMVGYAGGLNADNVVLAIHQINEAPHGLYWLDMETGVRTDGKFDLSRCRAVCEAVYGAAA